MTNLRASLPVRNVDKWGSGAYGATRGGREHRGIDIAAYPGTVVYPLRTGRVTKLGYPYRDDQTFRYVQVTDLVGGQAFRYFYLEPLVEPLDLVTPDVPIGVVQDLTGKYPGMINHVHVEVKDGEAYLDPTPFL